MTLESLLFVLAIVWLATMLKTEGGDD